MSSENSRGLLTRDYRPDINGLRAVAVISVLLFHFGVPGFRGGFVGVDVFFVISGFLMTQIILSRLRTESFSIREFYVARARRIVPALALVCSVVLFVGYTRLTPPDYVANSEYVLSSLTFLSNFDYVRRSGYFDALNSENWLLHTWSLSVEFQFYLVYPLVLVFLYKWRRRSGTLEYWIAGLFALSYFFSALPERFQPFSTFYALPTRAWEMLGGGLVYLSPSLLNRASPPKWLLNSKLLLSVGVTLIAISVLSMSAAVKWPGRMAMIPVFGSMLVLLANEQRSWIAKNRFSQFLGNISYSVYLWHWPLMMLLNQMPLGHALRTSIGLTGAVLIGWLSSRYIERSGYHLFDLASVNRSSLFGDAILTLLILINVMFAFKVATQDGFPNRNAMADYSKLAHEVRYVDLNEGWCFVDNRTLNIKFQSRFASCDVGDLTATKTALLWGDSHAGHYTPFVAEFAKAEHVKLRVLGTPECWPTFTGENLGINPDVCEHFRGEVLRIAKDFDWIILAARWDSLGHEHWEQDIRDTLQTLSKLDKQIIVLRQVPLFGTDIAHRYVYDGLFGIEPTSHYARDVNSDPHNERVRKLVAEVPNATFYDITNSICDRSDGNCTVLIDGTMLFADDQHLSEDGAIWIARHLIDSGRHLFR